MAGTALITGASSGIGRATVDYFAQRGWNVAATVRDPAKSADLTAKNSKNLAVLRLDVTDAAAIEQAVAGTVARFGKIDVLVNNAGYALFGPFEAASPEQIERQFATNVFGLMNVTRAVLPHLRAQKSGTIVNVASVGGRLTFPLYSSYHATKWAVEGFSESLHYELAPLGIRVRIVEPGPIRTDFYGRSADTVSRPDLAAYDDFVARTTPAMQEAGRTAPGPEVVAPVIYRAATDGGNRMRYTVNSAPLLALRRLLPDPLFFAFIRAAVVR